MSINVENIQLPHRRVSFWCRALCWILICPSIACIETPPEKEKQMVARVAQEAIYKSEVEEFAEMLSPGLRTRKSGREARLDYLQTLIDEKLLVLEARARGLDTTRAFATDLEKAFREQVVEHYRSRHLLRDSSAVDRAAWKQVIPERMFWEAARREGYHELASMLEWKEREEIEQLIEALRQKAVGEQVVVTGEEARQFYRDNPRLFEEPGAVWIQEILVDDADQAAQLRRRLDSGEEMDALVHLSQRPGAEETRGKWYLRSSEGRVFGDLIGRAFTAEVGQVVGPVETRDGYSVFRVLKKSGGQLQPFEEVAQRAMATLRLRQESQLFNVLVAAVREKYADQVRIFDEVLGAVQLPEKDALPSGMQLKTRDKLYRVGHDYFAKARYDKAVEAYQKLLEIDSLLVDARVNLGIAYQKLGRMAEAIEAFQTAIRIDSTFIPTYHNLALAHAAQGNFQAAYDEMEKALRLEPGAADTYRLLAFFYSQQGHYDQAEKILSQAVEADSSSAAVRQELGVLYKKQGRYREAETALLQAVELNPAYKEAWKELAGLYIDTGRHDEADRVLQRALELDPNYAEAYYNLAQLRSVQGKLEEAQRMMERFESLSTAPTR